MPSRVLDPCAIFRIRSWEVKPTPPIRLERALTSSWPNSTGTVPTGWLDILCTGPTDWLIVSPGMGAATLLQTVTDALAGSSFRATNLSSALTRIQRHTDPSAYTLLSKGCALDITPRSFLPGRCASTRFASLPVIIRCNSSSHLRMYPPRELPTTSARLARGCELS